MLVLRIIGAVLLLVAATVFVLDMMPALNGNNWRLSSFGESWFKLHSYSLNLTQVIVQRHISPDLWDDVLQPVLLYPHHRRAAGPWRHCLADPRPATQLR
jgi:hypothetical protein